MSASERARAVVDTNLFVSGTLLKRGAPYRLLEAFRAQQFTLVISEEQRAEIAEVLERPKLAVRYQVTEGDVAALLFAIDTGAAFTPLTTPLPIRVRDPKDEAVLLTALSGAADYLVTGDEDLLVLRGDPRLGALRIVTVTEFLAILHQPME